MKHSIEEATKKLQHYMNTYDKQHGYKDYRDETFIDDVLYGLGIALDDKYRHATGFSNFIDFLIDHLAKKPKFVKLKKKILTNKKFRV